MEENKKEPWFTTLKRGQRVYLQRLDSLGYWHKFNVEEIGKTRIRLQEDSYLEDGITTVYINLVKGGIAEEDVDGNQTVFYNGGLEEPQILKDTRFFETQHAKIRAAVHDCKDAEKLRAVAHVLGLEIVE